MMAKTTQRRCGQNTAVVSAANFVGRTISDLSSNLTELSTQLYVGEDYDGDVGYLSASIQQVKNTKARNNFNDIGVLRPRETSPIYVKIDVYTDSTMSNYIGTIDMGNPDQWKYFKSLLVDQDNNIDYANDEVLSSFYPKTWWVDPKTINRLMNYLDPDGGCHNLSCAAVGPCPPNCNQKILFKGLSPAFKNAPTNVSFLAWLDDHNLSKNLDSSTRFYTESIWYYKEQNNGAEVEVDKYSQVVPSYPEAGSRGSLAGIESIEELDEDAPVEDIISTFNTLLSALKRSAMSLLLGAAMLPIFAFGNSLEPDDPEGIWFKKIPGSTFMYTRDQINFQREKRYAMFVIPLNCKLEDHFTKFELKASTNNFTAADEWDRIVFWSLSTTADVTSMTNGNDVIRSDGMRLYIENLPRYYDQFATNIIDKSLMPTNNVSIDFRRYTRISNSLAVDNTYVLEPHDSYYVASYVVIVDPSLCIQHRPVEGWLSNLNDELIWTYSRATSAGVEKDQHGRILWRPITPVKWFKTLPKWADCEPIDNFDE